MDAIVRRSQHLLFYSHDAGYLYCVDGVTSTFIEHPLRHCMHCMEQAKAATIYNIISHCCHATVFAYFLWYITCEIPFTISYINRPLSPVTTGIALNFWEFVVRIWGKFPIHASCRLHILLPPLPQTSMLRRSVTIPAFALYPVPRYVRYQGPWTTPWPGT